MTTNADVKFFQFLTEPEKNVEKYDLKVENGELVGGDELQTAVLMSLFTDRRARADDRLPQEGASKRGWWGDTFPEVEGDQIGSRLWLLSREKTIPDTLNRAKDYMTEALQWLVDDGVAERIEVEAEFNPQDPIGFMRLKAEIFRPTSIESETFSFLWEQQAAA